MVIVSGAAREMAETERQIIGDIVGHLPVFRDFDHASLPALLEDCAALMARTDGLEATLSAIKSALPAKLRETAYAIACDLIAADGAADEDELAILELLRHHLDLDRLTAAAIERGARARFQML
jgi:tellurite resistance protein